MENQKMESERDADNIVEARGWILGRFGSRWGILDS